MERLKRKERQLVLYLQRRQQQQLEAMARKEIHALLKRQREREEQERARKKEDQMARRAAILEQYRLRKAIKEAKPESKTAVHSSSAATLRLRQQRTPRNDAPDRTIHGDEARRAKKRSSSCGSSQTSARLYKQPASKSNRSIILNAVEHCIFPGPVHREAKEKLIEKMARSAATHFLVLFRDAGCQFRALYSYQPESGDQVQTKLYGTGPTQVKEVMFDKFFKYISGSKCFAQVYTKHLTVTIDAFTIRDSIWQKGHGSRDLRAGRSGHSTH